MVKTIAERGIKEGFLLFLNKAVGRACPVGRLAL
jgi:hypothetical protein